MKKTILLFGFDQLPEILALVEAAKPFGAEVRTIQPRDCHLTLGRLAAGETGSPDDTPIILGGRMIVLCGLDRQLDTLIPALRKAGALCPKAVLTSQNREWLPQSLLVELQRELTLMGNLKKR